MLTRRTTPRCAKVVDMLDRQSAAAHAAGDDLLDVSRISRGEIVLQREPLDLREVAQHAIEAACRPSNARRHRCRRHSRRAGMVHGDFARLRKSSRTCSTTPVKFTPAGGLIAAVARVRFMRERCSASATTAAASIPSSCRACSPHFTSMTLRATASRAASGSASRWRSRLVELHGGSLEATSDGPNKGSEFIVRLPRSPHITSRADAQYTALLESPPEQVAAPPAATLPRACLSSTTTSMPQFPRQRSCSCSATKRASRTMA